MRRLIYLFPLAMAACMGAAPIGGNNGDDVDAGDDQPPPPESYSVSGRSIDYFTGLPLSQVALATDGMEPAMSGASDSQGNYTFDHIPSGTAFYVSASRDLYRPTRNLAVKVTNASLTMTDQLAVSIADSRRQYVTLNLSPGAGKSVLFALLLRNNGTPLEGVPLADITLVDTAGANVGLGPYFFGQTGDVVSNATLGTSTAYNGKARVAFLDVPPGSYTLKVKYSTGGGGGGGGGTPTIATYEIPVMAVADGATLVATGGGGTPPMQSARTFTADVYPRLQRAAQGGLGCAGCHTAGGVAAVLQYDLPVQDAYNAVKAMPNVVVPLTPATSLLLMKPLYEDPPNHPNATFLDVNDPDYIVFMQWIQQGANL